ncbi:MAG: exodeoxyribonuclease VII small subunit [Simkaniaceae bacterium]|nr:exodeoxyribonuclease VII small subunit [Simkaniaceae bacterium]
MTFEKNFKRLEEIVTKLSGTELSLEESIILYEEADKLIKACSEKLTAAEKKVEMLVKNRTGDLTMSESNTPQTEEFAPTR